MILLSNGCSHTSGAELDENNTDFCYEKAWPKHLADILGYRNINLARSGSSNDRILRTTYMWLSNYIAAGKDISKLFVVILWTGIYRTELATDDLENSVFYDNGWLPLIVGNDDQYKKFFDNHTYVYYKAWVANNNTRYNHTRFYMNILGMQYLLNYYKIPYLFWNSSVALLDTTPDTKTFFNLINKKHFPYANNNHFNHLQIAKRRNYKLSDISAKGNFKSHYDENAQKDFAKYLFKIITSKELFK